MDAYGFAGVVSVAVGLGVYFVWILSPGLLPQIAFPDSYWALVVPATLLVFLFTYGWTYGFIGMALNPDVGSWTSVADGHSRPLQRSDYRAAERAANGRETGPSSTPEFGDVPPAVVNALQRAAAKRPIGSPTAAR